MSGLRVGEARVNVEPDGSVEAKASVKGDSGEWGADVSLRGDRPPRWGLFGRWRL